MNYSNSFSSSSLSSNSSDELNDLNKNNDVKYNGNRYLNDDIKKNNGYIFNDRNFSKVYQKNDINQETKFNTEYMKKKYKRINKSYGIIAIQPTTIELHTAIKNFLLYINKLYINEDSVNTQLTIDKINNYSDNIKFLLISKKQTYGYTDIINGKYNRHNNNEIVMLFNQLTNEELNLITTLPFIELWYTIHDNLNVPFIEKAEKKFKYIISKIISNEIEINKNGYETPDWEFPKGKKDKNNHQEEDLDTATREFKEETGLESNEFEIFQTIAPIRENYYGTDKKLYNYVYYIALVDPTLQLKEINEIKKGQIDSEQEISQIGFYPYNKAIEQIRYYNSERKKILTCIFYDIINWFFNKNILINNL